MHYIFNNPVASNRHVLQRLGVGLQHVALGHSSAVTGRGGQLLPGPLCSSVPPDLVLLSKRGGPGDLLALCPLHTSHISGCPEAARTDFRPFLVRRFGGSSGVSVKAPQRRRGAFHDLCCEAKHTQPRDRDGPAAAKGRVQSLGRRASANRGPKKPPLKLKKPVTQKREFLSCTILKTHPRV